MLIRKCRFLIVGLFLMIVNISSAQMDEYKIKAALLVKILPYFQWEKPINHSDFTIAILGENPFGEIFTENYINAGQTVNKRPLKVIFIEEINIGNLPDVIFVCSDYRRDILQIINELKGNPVLIVGDTDGFGKKGVHVNFFISENKIRFELNEESLLRNKIKVDYRLRNIAKLVTD